MAPEVVHKDVPQIANLCKVPKSDSDVDNKSKAFTKFRNLGNFSHNVHVAFNCLPNNTILHETKLKVNVFADDNLNVAQMHNFILHIE